MFHYDDLMPLYLGILIAAVIWACSCVQACRERRRADRERAARKRSWDDTY